MSEAHGNAAVPPEPKTPMWLPALGAVLFLLAGLLWGLWPSGGKPLEPAAAPAASSGAAAHP
jgi:hypothetical protein